MRGLLASGTAASDPGAGIVPRIVRHSAQGAYGPEPLSRE
jgi:hypothetical protein